MKRGTFVSLAIVLLTALLVFGIARQSVERSRQGFVAICPPPESRLPVVVVKALAGEFKGVVSKYFLLEIGSFLGGKQEVPLGQWRNIAKTFGYCMELDPYFQQTYFWVQGNLPWEGFISEANALLEISRKKRTWDFRPGYYKGFNDYYFLNDYESASREFLRASNIENAPVLLAVLGARFAAKSGYAEAAVALLSEQLQRTEEENRRVELRDRIVALKGVMILEEAVARYRREYFSSPLSLESLIRDGILSELPENPYGGTYFYDPLNGTVAFDQVGSPSRR
jgi:hypothetical protein